MSYFLFGTVRLADVAKQELDEFGWQLVATGLDVRLYVLVGPNVMQPPVLDVLRDYGLLASSEVPFLLTISPIRDTSHELISPYQLAGGDLRLVRDSLDRVSDWLERVSKLQSVRSIQLFTSEGYDMNFTELESSPAGFVGQVMERIEEEGDVPSLRIHVALRESVNPTV